MHVFWYVVEVMCVWSLITTGLCQCIIPVWHLGVYSQGDLRLTFGLVYMYMYTHYMFMCLYVRVHACSTVTLSMLCCLMLFIEALFAVEDIHAVQPTHSYKLPH